jgi:hypothetical protein
MNSFVNNKSSEEDPRGPSGQTILDMMNSLTEGINFTEEELSNLNTSGSLALYSSSITDTIKSKLPDETSALLPEGLLNFNNLNDPSVIEINAFNEKAKLNDYIDSALKTDNKIRLNSYLTQRTLNGLPEIDDADTESMWKNDPYFEMDFLKENANYTDLEYRTSFTSEELEAVTIKFNLSEE